MKENQMKAPCGIEIFLLVAATLAAQDVVRVDPQHYKVLFENSHIRVIGGRDRSGDITPSSKVNPILSELLTTK
jgi:hypothetical protein